MSRMKEREKKIEAILDAMDTWDAETLLDWAKGARALILQGLDDEMLEDVYQEDVVDAA